ncbi:hypothetical protein T11_11316 [Trichinella zimbabwensis]|uniref:Uncharacterized protein n=1 Tax=Trichinella zimbabwensis TaxID=268475 RepID=A0A0V1HNR9_9BILA|nr:hypothetical protein T11_11316 [Trichinella zimbabwensis]
MNIFNVCGDTNFQLIYCIQKYATWATKINCYEHLTSLILPVNRIIAFDWQKLIYLLFTIDEMLRKLEYKTFAQHSRNTCFFNSYAPLIPYNLTQLPANCMGYHRTSTDLHVNYAINYSFG